MAKEKHKSMQLPAETLAGAAHDQPEDMAEGMVEGMVNPMTGRMEQNMASEGKPQGKPMSWRQLMREFRYTFFTTATRPLPDEFVQHMISARKESMLAARSLIDAGISKLEREEQRSKERQAHKIEVM